MKKDRKNLLCKMALVSCGYGMFSDSVIVPILTDIYNEFAQSGIFIRNFVVTGGYFFSLIAAIVTGILVSRVSKRKLLIAAMICFIVGGVGGGLSSSMEFLAITRIIDGISDGMINVVAMALINELYKDEHERAQTIALHTGIAAGFGVMLSLFSGLIAQAYNWRYAFLLNLGAIISLVFIILAVPDTMRSTENSDRRISISEKIQRTVNPKTIKTYAGHFISSAWYCILFVFVDLYVREKSFGASSLSGIISSIGSVTVFLTGFIFAAIYTKLKENIEIFAYIGLSVSFIVLAVIKNLAPAFVTFIFAAFLYTLLNAYYQFKITLIVEADDVGLCMGVMNSVYNLGCFISSYIPYAVMAIFNVNTVYASFGYLAIPLVLFTILIKIPKKNVHKS